MLVCMWVLCIINIFSFLPFNAVCSDMGLVKFTITICFPLSSFYFLIYFQSSDIFISIWDLTICHNHVWPMKAPKSGKQTLMYLFVRWPDSRNHICVFFDFILMFSSAGVPILFRGFNVPPLFFLYVDKELKFEILADSGDESCNTASMSLY